MLTAKPGPWPRKFLMPWCSARIHWFILMERLQGRTHQVVTAICLLHLRGHRQRIFCESTAVTFRPLDAVKIRRYLTQVNPLDKADAYGIQEDRDQIIESISDSYTNVISLPLE